MRALSFSQVNKFYQSYQALNNLSFSVEAGEIVGLLGPNGAGKSTTLEILLGLKNYESGEVKIFDLSPGHPDLKKRVSCIPQELAFPPHLKVKEVLAMVASMYQVEVPLDLLERFQVQGFLDKLAGVLSGGQKRRLALALAFLPKPDLVILDEPTTGLDVEGKALMWSYLDEFKNGGGTLLITSHDLFELTQLADRLLLIEQGQLLFEGTAREMLSRCRFKKVSFHSNVEHFDSHHISKSEFFEGQHIVWTQNADAFVAELISKQYPYRDLTIEVGDLHEIFHLLRGTR